MYYQNKKFNWDTVYMLMNYKVVFYDFVRHKKTRMIMTSPDDLILENQWSGWIMEPINTYLSLFQ